MQTLLPRLLLLFLAVLLFFVTANVTHADLKNSHLSKVTNVYVKDKVIKLEQFLFNLQEFNCVFAHYYNFFPSLVGMHQNARNENQNYIGHFI
jgi:hypothetical protein